VIPTLLLLIQVLSISLGDLRFKKFGVTPEPQVKTHLLEGWLVCNYFTEQSMNRIFLRERMGLLGVRLGWRVISVVGWRGC